MKQSSQKSANKPKIIFETDNYLVIEKPAGMLSYPLPGKSEKTVADIMHGLSVHRLDRDTSGVLLLAKNEEAKEKLQKLFASREIKKTYIALVWGNVEPSNGEIIIPLGRGTKDRLRVVPSSGGRESHTVYKVQKYFPRANMSLLSVCLKTGRTHQIRVHFQAIGHPIVGDKKYSSKRANTGRQFLHAYSLEFKDPFDGKIISLSSDLPSDLDNFLKKLS